MLIRIIYSNCNRLCYLCYFHGMRQSVSKIVAFIYGEKLHFALKAAERGGVNESSVVSAKGTPIRNFRVVDDLDDPFMIFWLIERTHEILMPPLISHASLFRLPSPSLRRRLRRRRLGFAVASHSRLWFFQCISQRRQSFKSHVTRGARRFRIKASSCGSGHGSLKTALASRPERG